MKRALFIIVLLPFLGACTYTPLRLPQANITTNIPFYSTTVTVLNGTNLTLDIVRDGLMVRKNLRPGQYFTTEVYNLSASSMQTTFIAIGREGGKFVGTASRSFYINGYGRQSEAWTVRRHDIQN